MKSDVKSGQWFEDVLNAMSELVLVKGDRSKLLWANRAFREHYGMSNAELQNLIDAPHSDPDDTVQYVVDDHHVYNTGTALDIPSEAVTDSKGRISYFHTIKSPIFDAQNEVERTVGVSRPVLDEGVVERSEHNRSVHKNSLSELRTLVKNIPLAVAMLDIKQRFVCYSEAWLKLTKYEGSELTGEFYDEHFEGLIPLRKRLSEVSTTHQGQAIFDQRMNDGSQRMMSINIDISPWALPSGETGGTIVLVQDVTKLQESERELTRLNEELMQFNYRVSHDFVSPLKTIRGLLAICETELKHSPEKVAVFHDKIIHQVDTLSVLVQNVLNLARSDISDDVNEEVDLNAVVGEILKSEADSIKDIEMNVELNFNPHRFISKRFRIKQILHNLISNAIKYHDPKKQDRTLMVSAERSNQTMVIEVADNGIGLADNLAFSAFDIFVRGSSKHPGHGLGLYIVKKHVDQLGGEAMIVPDMGKTIFRIVLPLRGAIQ